MKVYEEGKYYIIDGKHMKCVGSYSTEHLLMIESNKWEKNKAETAVKFNPNWGGTYYLFIKK